MRIRPLAPLAVIVAFGCTDAPQSLVAPTDVLLANVNGSNGKGSDNGNKGGKGGGGGGGSDDGGGGGSVTEDFLTFDDTRWVKRTNCLGFGCFYEENVVLDGSGHLELVLPEGTLDGGSIGTTTLHKYGVYEARLKAADQPGSLTAFYMYADDGKGNFNEIDVEIIPDRGHIGFTVWADVPVEGPYIPTHTVKVPFPEGFDPHAYHVYTIDFDNKRIRFHVDGVVQAEFNGKLPKDPMYVRSNAWYPLWLGTKDEQGNWVRDPSEGTARAVIDWISY